MSSMELIVGPNEERISLKRFLALRLPGLSQMYLATRVHQGQCTVQGEVMSSWGRKMRAGERVEIDVDLDANTARKPENLSIEIVFEDDRILVLNKASGMLVHPTKAVKTGTLANAVAWHLKGARFWFPHRLDRETSGVIIVAKTAEAMREISLLWMQKSVHKEYLALVEGVLAIEQLRIDAPIHRDGDQRPQWHVSPQGKEAITLLQVERHFPAHTLLRLQPVTGRTNQLRIHCAHIGYPIVGDPLYGSGPADRLWLHAEYAALGGLQFRARPQWVLPSEESPDGL